MTRYFLLFILISQSVFAQTKSDAIVGIWLSEAKDLKVEVYKQKNQYFGKMVWFDCPPNTPPMEHYKDKANPNPSLRSRAWLGMILLKNLVFDGKNEWENGDIYDPNSGSTYRSKVKLLDAQTLHVRGYIGIPLFGKTMVFSREKMVSLQK
jgi:uncharacterized protein (DUF2147 family)